MQDSASLRQQSISTLLFCAIKLLILFIYFYYDEFF